MKYLKKTFLIILLALTILFAKEKQKIIFDCDLGGDIDDAFAVSLVLASPEFEVLGLVMDHGNTAERAKIASRLLYETGKADIPIIVGEPTPNVVGKDDSIAGYAPQFNWAKNFEKVKTSSQSADDFIINQLNKYPNEVILFTVGPVTNIKHVLEKDPDILQKTQRVVSMFGSFHMGYGGGPIPDPEWNVRADVEAAKMLINSGADLTLAGLDITTNVKLNERRRKRIFMRESPLTDALSGLYTLWRYESYSSPNPTLYDVVAVGMVLWPDLYTTRKAHVDVTSNGFTILDNSKKPNCKIGMKINQEKFLDRIMERYIKQNLYREY